MKKQHETLVHEFRFTRSALAMLVLAAAMLTGCRGDIRTHEKHVEDVRQDVETNVIVE